MAKKGKKPKSRRRRANPRTYKLKSGGVADKEKFLRGCLAVMGLLLVVIVALMIAQAIFG